jgi:guanylate kinase
MLLVISAPSGAGKTTIIKELLKKLPSLRFSVSATTREKRTDEKDNVDYYFISKEEFQEKIRRNEFIEWEELYGDYYGTPKTEIEKSLSDSSDMVFEVDVKGALSIKSMFPEAVTIFVDAPKDDLIRRLRNRNTDSSEQIKKRIARMELEISLKRRFDHIVMNTADHSGLENAVNQIIGIINNLKAK